MATTKTTTSIIAAGLAAISGATSAQSALIFDQQRQRIANQQKQAIVEQQKQSLISQQKHALISQQKQSLVSQQKQALISQQKQSLVSQQKQALISQQKQSLVSQQKQALISQQKQSLVGQQKQALISQQKQSLVGQQKQALISQQKQSLVSQQKHALMNQQKQSLVGGHRDAMLDQQKQALVGQQRQVVVPTNFPGRPQVPPGDLPPIGGVSGVAPELPRARPPVMRDSGVGGVIHPGDAPSGGAPPATPGFPPPRGGTSPTTMSRAAADKSGALSTDADSWSANAPVSGPMAGSGFVPNIPDLTETKTPASSVARPTHAEPSTADAADSGGFGPARPSAEPLREVPDTRLVDTRDEAVSKSTAYWGSWIKKGAWTKCKAQGGENCD